MLNVVASGDAGVLTDPTDPGVLTVGDAVGGKGGGKSRTPCPSRELMADGTCAGNTGGWAAQRIGSAQTFSKAAMNMHMYVE
jgi:hypothetical protein